MEAEGGDVWEDIKDEGLPEEITALSASEIMNRAQMMTNETAILKSEVNRLV